MPTKKLPIEALVAEAEAIGFTNFVVDSRGGVHWGWEPLLPTHTQMRTRLARRRKELAEYLRHRMRAEKRKPLVVPCDECDGTGEVEAVCDGCGEPLFEGDDEGSCAACLAADEAE